MAERDRLLAQANSLVKNLNGARASTSTFASEKAHDRPLTPQPRPLTSTPQPSPPTPSRQRSVTEGEADHQPLTFRRNLRSDAQPTDTIPIPMMAGNERDDIEIRVTRFREQQTRLTLERQAFSESALRQMHSSLKKYEDG
jgi:hypothetical protein